MTDLDNLPERPPLTIEVNGDVIKMTYGLEMDLRRLLPDAQTALILLREDVFTQDYLIRRVLTKSNKMLTDPDQLISLDETDLSSDDVERILTWVGEHALYFFVKRIASLAALGVRYNQAPPTPSSDGSENSASTTPSAGPSAA